MQNKKLHDDLCRIYGNDRVYREYPMQSLTYFKIGGPAELIVFPTKSEEIVETLQCIASHHSSFFMMGKGSNLLVKDGGMRGVVVNTRDFNSCRVEGTTLIADAGAPLCEAVNKGLEHGLVGMEFAAGIPGSVGGAVTMNAGAYCGEIKDVLKAALVSDLQGASFKAAREELDMAYRTTRIQSERLIVLRATFQLEKGDTDQSIARIQELNSLRREKQPLEYPSGGSVFKRPQGYYVGKLIQDAGLKGYAVGGAQISEKHAGFIINKNNARAEDVLAIIEAVQKRIFSQFGVMLETELKIVGDAAENNQ